MPHNHQNSIRYPAYDTAQRPFIVIWEVTRACDLACIHCRAEAIPARNPFELSTAEGKALIDQVAAFGPPPPLFVITGGDPMKRPDLAELIAHAAERNLKAALSPSATPLLTPAAIANLRSAGLTAISLSVDGAGARVHDAFRGFEGVFERTMAAWTAARECGLKVQINTTVARQNLGDLPLIARMVRDRGAFNWGVFFLVPVGRGIALEPISAAECEDVMHFLYDVATVVPLKTTEGHHYKRVVLERIVLERAGIPPGLVLPLGATYRVLRRALDWPANTSRVRRAPMDINAGRGFVFISHVGSVHPSGFLPLGAGNIRQQRLAKIYPESPLFSALRDPMSLSGRCGRCEFARVCGGSRSRAYAVTEDPCGEDPLCAYEPGSFPLQDELAALLAEEGSRPARMPPA
jgi:AdoMet-dependent heme synthase